MIFRDHATGSARPEADGARDRGIRWISGKRLWKNVAFAALAGILPFGVWLMGTAVSWVTPPSFQSSALVKIDGTSVSPAAVADGMRSEEVMREAVRLLSDEETSFGADPMSAYLLSTSLVVEPKAGPDVLRLEARSVDADDARRMVLAVVEAYSNVHLSADAGAELRCVYVDPTALAPDRVSDESRMVLGLGGLAALGLLLAIPLLEGMERAMPIRRVAVAGQPAE